MSKKKSFSGSTMTLKDFHGGSIPSDLPLPSAPGVMVRHSDRPTSWGNPIGRSDHRSRPGSSGASHTYDEKASFFSHPQPIGRNFDEDERKPLDGISAPRRTVSDDTTSPNIWAPTSRPETKPDAGKFSSWQPSNPIQAPVKLTSTTVPVANSVPNSAASPTPNAWAARKEVTSVPEPAPSSWSGPSTVSKFAQASALENIQSGRWQSKPSLYNQLDVEAIRNSEPDIDLHGKDNNNAYRGTSGYIGVDQMSDTRGRYGGGKEHMNHDLSRPPTYSPDQVRPASTEGKLGGGQHSLSQSQAVLETPDRPKLKLLPRKKPLESSESQVHDLNQGYQAPGLAQVISETHGISNSPKTGSNVSEGGSRAVERPKLNLKPRSQCLDQSSKNIERGRNALFGGARPRELVLKERGVDDVVVNNHEVNQPPVNRGKSEVLKPDTKVDPNISAARHSEKPEHFLLDQKNARDFDRRDHHLESEKVDLQRNSWRNEKRNGRENEKQYEQWRPEPETCRKPIEPPKPVPSETPGPRYGRSASALELAQAFSRSVSASDARAADRLTSQRKPVPFSRLTDSREFYTGPTPRHINGY
ncbi:hypothetical protein H6P81_007185 [Aristolochia fimbriata]|uniref:Uncharacterized protein n=1 Tax=Aristolochia fimbriata TaxID=158543 RepID=A0AAV7F0N2_ARIFI|nr:hypothetical protein H6P81_007185 [Aristolochia fimbriata]